MKPKSERKKKRSKQPQRRRQISRPRTAKQYSAMSDSAKERWNRVPQAITRMRDHKLTLKQAAKAFGLTTVELRKLAGPALQKKKGRYVARPTDNLIREAFVPTSKGLKAVILGDSREASRLGRYWDDVREYSYTGDASGLKKPLTKAITDINGKRVRLITNPDEIDRLAHAGVLSFESLYARG
jgi:hypothetical protein